MMDNPVKRYPSETIYVDIDNTILATNKLLKQFYPDMQLSLPSHKPLDESKYTNKKLFERHLEIIKNINIIDRVIEHEFSIDKYESYMYHRLVELTVIQPVMRLVYKLHKATGYHIRVITAKQSISDNTYRFLQELFKQYVPVIVELDLYPDFNFSERVYVAYSRRNVILIDDYEDIKQFVKNVNNNMFFHVVLDNNMDFIGIEAH